MKQFLGIIAILITLGFATIGVLALWGIYFVDMTLVFKILATIALVVALIIFLWISFAFFFKKEKVKQKGNKAHLMN